MYLVTFENKKKILQKNVFKKIDNAVFPLPMPICTFYDFLRV